MTRRPAMAFSAKLAASLASMLLLLPLARADEGAAPDSAPLPTKAGDFTFKIETGVAIPLTSEQSQLFKVGGGQSIKALWALNRYLDLGPSASFVGLPAAAANTEAGAAWGFGGSLRLKRPHDAPDHSFLAISPWADVDALYVRTGNLNRAGFAVGAGLSMPIGRSRIVWAGPFVRYQQILQEPERTGFDNRDAKIFMVGLGVEMGSGIEREREVIAVTEVPPQTIIKETFVCPDRDGDGVPDSIDRCPDVKGPIENWGCPVYNKVIVTADHLVLKEKIHFAWNDVALLDSSFFLLDEVATVLQDHKNMRVAIDGNASSEGANDHNQALSEGRAKAVLDYLVSHGVAKERLVAKGFSSSMPIDTNKTEAGRENNRRVEFVVSFIILNDGSK